MPLEKVLVAVFDWKILPPVRVRPFDEPRLNADMPPLNVEDAVEVEIREKIVEVAYAVMGPAIVVLPCTESVDPGVVVPMPNKEFVVSTERKLADPIVDTPV